jgi:hypothetical protein
MQHARREHSRMYVSLMWTKTFFFFNRRILRAFQGLVRVCVWRGCWQSCARVRECVYHLYVYGNAVCEPVLYVHLRNVFGLFSILVYTRITWHAYSCICMSLPIDVCSIDVLLLKQSCTYLCQLYMSTLYCLMRCQIISTLVTHALTHSEITRTPLRCGGDECDSDSLSLLIQW